MGNLVKLIQLKPASSWTSCHMQILRCDFSTIVQLQLICILFIGASWSRPLPFSTEDKLLTNRQQPHGLVVNRKGSWRVCSI